MQPGSPSRHLHRGVRQPLPLGSDATSELQKFPHYEGRLPGADNGEQVRQHSPSPDLWKNFTPEDGSTVLRRQCGQAHSSLGYFLRRFIRAHWYAAEANSGNCRAASRSGCERDFVPRRGERACQRNEGMPVPRFWLGRKEHEHDAEIPL